jgi:putative transposase
MSRNFTFSENEFYHIYNRGTDKRVIFNNKNDYRRFITLLYLCNASDGVDVFKMLRSEEKEFQELIEIERDETLVEIGAYCLMPNHFHILIREKQQGGISLFMKKLSTAYTMYFNSKYKRTGSLFQGRFKAKHANDDRYLQYLFSYIHLNPVKLIEPTWTEEGIKDFKKAKNYLRTYYYSSYPDYSGLQRKEVKILEIKNYPEYFKNSNEFKALVHDWMKNKDLPLL